MSVRNDSWRHMALAAALLGLMAVLLGAVGSHAIDLSAEAALRRWNVALQIHYFQAAALLALAGLQAAVNGGRSPLIPASSGAAAASAASLARGLTWIGRIQTAGTVLFCGSLYLRSAQLLDLPGWITPAGGLLLLTGWLAFIVILVIKVR